MTFSIRFQIFRNSNGSVQFSHSVVSDSLRPHESQHTRSPCPSPTPGVYPNPFHRVGDVIHPSHPLLSPSPPAPNPSQHWGLFQWVNSLHEVVKVLEFQWFPITLTGWAWHLLLQHCFTVSRRMGIASQQWSLLITREASSSWLTKAVGSE